MNTSSDAAVFVIVFALGVGLGLALSKTRGGIYIQPAPLPPKNSLFRDLLCVIVRGMTSAAATKALG